MKKLVFALAPVILVALIALVALASLHNAPVVSAHVLAACAETGLTNSAAQENMLFCQGGLEPDGGFVYHAAIAAADNRIIVGTPTAAYPSLDWAGNAIVYVEFSSGFHAEYHADNFVRIYNTLNQRVSP